MKLLILLATVMLVTACGGGGGGGGGGGNGVSAANNVTPVVQAPSYVKNINASSFDEVAAAFIFVDNLWCEINENNALDFNLTTTTDESTIVNFDASRYFADDDFETDLSKCREKWSVTDNSDPQAAGNLLDDNAAWFEFAGSDRDLNELTEDFYYLKSYLVDGEFTGTEYVSPLITFKDYGGDSLYGTGWNGDTDLRKQAIAAAVGDYTQSSDMPASGSFSLEGASVAAAYVSSFRRNEYSTQAIDFYMAVDSTTNISVDHAAKTLIGQAALDFVFTDQLYLGSQLEGTSLGTVNFEGTISGNRVSGTARWGTEDNDKFGNFEGRFFGPDGREFGGVVTVSETNDSTGFNDYIVVTIVGHR
jgi:hypothetical protein